MSRDASRNVGHIADAQAEAAQYIAHAARGVAVIDAATVIGVQCPTCDGFMCLDCIERVEHIKCTRACPDCLIENADWDQSLEMSQIVTELRGLHALDDAVGWLDHDQTMRSTTERHGDLSA